MATKRSRIPRYGTVEIKGHTYYKTYVMDSDGKQVALYEKTREALYDKELAASAYHFFFRRYANGRCEPG